jgi:hypothetical protein
MTGHPPSHYRDIIARICEQDDDDDGYKEIEALDREMHIADRRLNLDRAPFGRYVRITNEGYYLEIPLKGIRACGVDLISVTMYIAPDEYEADGDLAVEYDTTGPDDQGIRQAMDNFYRKRCWTHELQVLLQRVGFGTEAAGSVEGSESGMQDDGRASYDAELIANEVRSAADPSGILRGGHR